MKKITLFLMLLCSAITFGQVGFSQNFNAATALPAGWTQNRYFGTATQACEGNSFRSNIYSGATTSTGNLGTPNFVGQSNGTDLTVSFDYKIVNWSAATVATPAGWGTAQLQFSLDNGTTWTTAPSGTINDSNHVVANTCATFNVVIPGASLPNGSDVKLRVLNTWASGDYYFYIDNFSGAQVASNPPNCTTLTAPLNGATNVNEESNLTWAAATGVPTGYFLSVGTTPGGVDVVNNVDNGNSTSYALPTLMYSTLYYVTITPYNANGNAMGCTEESFETRPAPPVGQVCGNPIVVGALPYNTSDNTNVYADDYNGSPGASCGSTNGYLNGDDVVYAYTATSDATINFALSGIGANYAGMFLYSSCGDIGTTCIAGATNGASTADFDFDYNVTNGQTYYVVISTWATPQSTAYTLDIREILCADPSDLAVANITTTTADLSWTDNNSTATPNWNIEILPSGNAPTNMATDTATTNSFQATGLTANMSYDYYVQADCGGGTLSLWVGPFTFTTACNAFVAPYLEDFEAFPTATSAFISSNCWTGTGGAYYWESAPGTDTGSADTGPSPTITTGNYFYTEASAGASGDITELISPSVDLSGLTAPSLSFNYHMYGVVMGTLDVLVNGTDNVFTISGQQQANDTDPFELATIDLAAYAGQTITVTFRATSAGTFEGDLSIDNVNFDELPTCPQPNMLTVANITDTTADLGWTENGTATVWDVEVVDITAGGTPTGTPTATGVSNPYTVMSLTPNNAYEFYVRASCGGDVSTWVGPLAFSTVCSTFTAPYTEDFENAGVVPDCWTLAGGDDWDFNLTGPNHVGNAGTITGSTTSGNYYAVVDDSGLTSNVSVLESPFVDLTPLTTPALTFFEISDNEGNANATLTVEVWDGAAWNTVGTYNTNTAGWELKTINLSTLTFTGPAQARFSVADSGSFYDDIAIDDVSFVELPACPQPSMLTVTNITATTAELGWTDNGTATVWDIEIVDVTAGGTPTGTPTVSGVTNPYVITGLNPQNDYAFYVRAVCGGDLSSFSGPSNFRTACATITVFPSTTDFTNNPPTTCWDEAADGEVAAGPSGLGASDWRGNRSYFDVNANVVNSNALNLFTGNVDREWLLSPTYTIPSGTPHGLKVQVAVTNYNFSGSTSAGDTMGSDDEVMLLMTTDNGVSWTTLTTWNAGNQPSVNGTDYLADLSAVSGDVRFAFWGSDGITNDIEDYDFHVGAFTVDLLSALSTEEFNTNNLDFSYYPNPVSNELTINAATKLSSVSVINVLGQTVYSTTPNTNKVMVNMSELNAGYYFVKVVSGNASKTIKVIKN
ncbi:fibronectin type III domain-containing protein [Aurantibacter aestuarii]|uniref:Uncharacterized protein n=1 Tax=Aurantibacter aestuarii TaxID=1266046 RepID=A0A2T1N8A4_9FLAO|nr:fibronectin type III domain-containing protein [Aurantibacter aestuarii]PSG88098.1 hypothetical protein C7H52_07270 [Aurantibacter aestuarii]